MNDAPGAIPPKADPTYAELLTRNKLRQAAWEGPTRNERKLVLLRLCDHADPAGIAGIELRSFAIEVHLPVVQVRAALVKLMRRGDITQQQRTRQYFVRSYRVSPRS
ncbi:MAG TPA: hypothetical protein VNJ10_05965 [Sphingomonas sp.]|nr:hypothetical protein [Sphingomonas sp.]